MLDSPIHLYESIFSICKALKFISRAFNEKLEHKLLEKLIGKKNLGLTDVRSASQHAKLFLCIASPVILKKKETNVVGYHIFRVS